MKLHGDCVKRVDGYSTEWVVRPKLAADEQRVYSEVDSALQMVVMVAKAECGGFITTLCWGCCARGGGGSRIFV